jgi:hypothetical protein
MVVYCVIIEDRHVDVDVKVWLKKEKAIQGAKNIANEICRFPEDIQEENLTDEMIKDGWVYYCICSCEGDCVRVVKRNIKYQD